MSTRYVWERFGFDYVKFLDNATTDVGYWYDGTMMTGSVSTVYYAIYSSVTNAIAGQDNTSGISLSDRGGIESFDVSQYSENSPLSIQIPANSALIFSKTQSGLSESKSGVWGACVASSSAASITLYKGGSRVTIGSWNGAERFCSNSKAVKDSYISGASQRPYPALPRSASRPLVAFW